MNKALVSFISLLLSSLLLTAVGPSQAGEKGFYLRRGIEQYKLENYEEAIDMLRMARRENPESSAAAFFLGLSYKQTMDYQNASEHLRDALTLTPRIKEALVELVEVLFRLGERENLDEAKKWIRVAEREEIFPAKIAFLKGLIYQKEGKNELAIEAFEKAASLDRTITQASEFQIALCHVQEKRLEKAKEKLQAAILADPRTDLAAFARRYRDLVDRRMEMERPLRVTLGVFGQYDTNVVLKPLDSSVAPGVTDEESGVLASTLRLDYVPVLEGPWLFNAYLAGYGRFHDEHAETHDNISGSVYAVPGYNFGFFSLNLAIQYDYAWIRSPDYEKYASILTGGPLFRKPLGDKHLLELFAGYAKKEYYTAPLIPEEDRDSDGPDAYLSWIWIFKENAFFNFRYGYFYDDTVGKNWENTGHRFSLNATIPLIDKLDLQLGGQAILQNYENVHTVFGIKREDKYYQGLVGLSWEAFRHINIVAQYNRTRAESNIEIYDYKRDIYSLGFELRF